jgi:hypothetical protein
LKGQGIPAKATLGSIAILVVLVAVPILAGAVLLDRYLHNKEVIAIGQQGIAKSQETIDRFAADVRFQEQMEKRRGDVNSRLAEVKTYLGDYVQWSPLLITLAENMPAEMVISKLTAEVRRSLDRGAQSSDPNRPANVNITKRTLTLDISSAAGSYDTVVRGYGDRLRSSPSLGPKLENITIDSQRTVQSGDEKTVIYTMKLMFKAGS